jgi:hypothetical protein
MGARRLFGSGAGGDDQGDRKDTKHEQVSN